MASSTPIKLVYFNFRGKGELLRYILTVAGVDFVDERLEFSEWPQHKKTTLSPNGKLPYLEIDGERHAESLALARFAAKRYGLAGKNETEMLKADGILCTIDDVRNLIYLFELKPFLTADQKKSLKESFKNDQCPDVYLRFENILSGNSSGFLVGDKLTFADLALADINDQVQKVIPGFFSKFLKVKAHWAKVKAIPKLASYLAKRKDTDI